MMTVVRRITKSQEETMALAAKLASRLQAGDIIALEGPLGAGKTTFVRGLAQGLGLDPQSVSSPTFIICQEYETDRQASVMLAHIDAYRLRSAGELDTIGWDDLLAAPRAVIAIEWQSRVREAVPSSRRIEVAMEHSGDHHRSIEIVAPPPIAQRLEGFDE